MGCDNSKTVRVQPVGPSSAMAFRNKEGGTQMPATEQTLHTKRRSSGVKDSQPELDLDSKGNKVNKVKTRSKRSRSPATKDLMGSCGTLSLDDTRSLASDRGFSATSKQSADSGLGEDNAHVITEFSEEDKIKEVENNFRARNDLDLQVTGVPCSTRLTRRQDEAHVLQRLREEGLISRPRATTSGGLCFEIVSAEAEGEDGGSGPAGPKPPLRLEKLSVTRARAGKKSRAALTEADIRDKLDRAERRRKKREQERLAKVRDLGHTDGVSALEQFTQYQKTKQETMEQRMEQVEENRQKQLQEVRERQELRQEHALKVRQRRTIVVQESGDTLLQKRPSAVTVTTGSECRTQSPELTSKFELTSKPEVPSLDLSHDRTSEEGRERSDSRGSSRGSLRSRE